MGRILIEDLIYEILSVVEEIPPGRVATYGQIAGQAATVKSKMNGAYCANL